MKIPPVVVAAIVSELDRAEKLHPNYPHDPLRRVAIVGEEAGEALRAALDMTRPSARAVEREYAKLGLVDELVQVASTAIRALIAFDEENS